MITTQKKENSFDASVAHARVIKLLKSRPHLDYLDCTEAAVVVVVIVVAVVVVAVCGAAAAVADVEVRSPPP